MKLKTTSIALLAALCMASTPLAAETYAIDTKGAHASINFRIKHLGYSWLAGRFDTFDGTFEYDPQKPESSTVSVTIDTASVNSNHAERDKHLRSADFLNVEKYPKATFVSKKVTPKGAGKADIIGDLTLNGVTKPVTIAADYVGGGRDPWGGTRAGFSGTTTLKLKDFNVKMDLGPASQTVDLMLEVEGIKK